MDVCSYFFMYIKNSGIKNTQKGVCRMAPIPLRSGCQSQEERRQALDHELDN